jgi:hypothetical protein
MRVHFERSGGFAGLYVSGTVDSADLPPEEESELNRLVKAANFFELPEVIRGVNPGVDRFQYKLTVEDGTKKYSVEFDEAATPETLLPLLTWLRSRAHKQ